MLHRRSGFQDLLTTVGDTTGAGAALVEKDYWVTEALRPIAADFRGGVVFKGGTSLSKAWNLIRRFSEDVDPLIRQDHGRDTRGARDRYMKDIESAVGAIDGLTCTHEGARSERGISRTAVFRYTPRTAARDGLKFNDYPRDGHPWWTASHLPSAHSVHPGSGSVRDRGRRRGNRSI